MDAASKKPERGKGGSKEAALNFAFTLTHSAADRFDSVRFARNSVNSGFFIE